MLGVQGLWQEGVFLPFYSPYCRLGLIMEGSVNDKACCRWLIIFGFLLTLGTSSQE
jgi:hypothetical protein